MLIRNTPILMYHSISETAAPKFRQFAVPPEQFRQQIAYLHHHDYTTLTVIDFAAAVVDLIFNNGS